MRELVTSTHHQEVEVVQAPELLHQVEEREGQHRVLGALEPVRPELGGLDPVAVRPELQPVQRARPVVEDDRAALVARAREPLEVPGPAPGRELKPGVPGKRAR